jgi:hypothetical protein
VETSIKVIFTLASHASLAVAFPKTGAFGQKAGTTNIGQVTTGGVMSRTTMVTLQDDVLPQSSLAVQARVTWKVPGQLPGVVTSAKVMDTLASQASVAVAGPNDGVAGQLTGDVTSGQVIDGGMLSITWIVLLQKDVLPHSSVATQTRVTLYVPGQPPGVVASLKEMATLGSH